jgi:hypothetical protein
MIGYGWSLWYIPENWKEIAETYGFQHVPHVTLQSNLTKEEAIALFEKSAKTATIRLESDLVVFPTMYEVDPLKAAGWYATGIDTPHRPHMSVRYWTDLPVDLTPCGNPPDVVECFLAIADTQLSPSEWTFTIHP